VEKIEYRPEGLRTRMPLRWRFVPWEQIEDIYVAKPTGGRFGGKSHRVKVRLTSGKVLTLPAPLSETGSDDFTRAAEAITDRWESATGVVSLEKRD
jgi:hypothetical protein